MGTSPSFSAGNDATGAFTVTADEAGVILSGAVVEQGDVTIAAGSGTIAINEDKSGNNATGHAQGTTGHALFDVQAGSSLTINEPLTPTRVVPTRLRKVGDGLLVLGGANSYNDLTTVAEGELRITGSVDDDVFVGNGATISGTGTIAGDLDFSGAAGAVTNFRPGNAAVGNLNVSGTTTFEDSTNLFFELDAPAATAAAASTAPALAGDDHATLAGNVVSMATWTSATRVPTSGRASMSWLRSAGR